MANVLYRGRTFFVALATALAVVLLGTPAFGRMGTAKKTEHAHAKKTATAPHKAKQAPKAEAKKKAPPKKAAPKKAPKKIEKK